MRWTALDLLGKLARTEGRAVSMNGYGNFTANGEPYVPVLASDPSGVALLVYRDANDDSVNYLSSFGAQGQLGHVTVGKWPIAIAALGNGLFLVHWIESGLNNVARARVSVSSTGTSVERLSNILIPHAQIILSVNANGEMVLDVMDDGYQFKSYTRAGLTIPLVYAQEVNGRVVGVDGRPDAPNQALLADADGWYLVSTTNDSAQFPPRVDVNGNVATFQGDYFTNDEIRSRPIAVDPTVPRIPVYTVTAGAMAPASEKLSTAINNALSGEKAEAVIIIAGLLLLYFLSDSRA